MSAPSPATPMNYVDRFKHAMWLLCRFEVHRYLMSNTHGRWNGAEKALRHMNLCTNFVAALTGDEEQTARMHNPELYTVIHDRTQLLLTDNLDTSIGFPLEDERPDYDVYAPKFFALFYETAMDAFVKEAEWRTLAQDGNIEAAAKLYADLYDVTENRGRIIVAEFVKTGEAPCPE